MTHLPSPAPTLPISPTVAFTGHRPGDRSGGSWGPPTGGVWDWARSVVPDVLTELDASDTWSGGALGFDMLAGYLSLTGGWTTRIAIPFDGHDARWRDGDRRRLSLLRGRADEVVVVSDGGYHVSKLFARNAFMLERADVVVALWDGRPGGGTAGTVADALRRGLAVVHLHSHDRTVTWLVGD